MHSVGIVVDAGRSTIENSSGPLLRSTAVAPGDGTVLLTGGESGDQAVTRTPSNTVEIFADPITPPGVAE